LEELRRGEVGRKGQGRTAVTPEREGNGKMVGTLTSEEGRTGGVRRGSGGSTAAVDAQRRQRWRGAVGWTWQL
jgi:hypothetical protein